MNDDEPCEACTKIIKAPSTVEPHAGLRRCGPFKLFADHNTDTFWCDICHTGFKRREAIPRRTVTWTVIEDR